ncbi:hypothetical protein CKO45_12780 [Paracraurococcus ruber]|uniref:Uncharacterized protein n=1 Tax=Paracraurococcus ruber TaxID=77675 RepID=A0ABS1CXH2_9PROT|nr:hypothetical protein [Paracraurococcus ruber]
MRWSTTICVPSIFRSKGWPTFWIGEKSTVFISLASCIISGACGRVASRKRCQSGSASRRFSPSSRASMSSKPRMKSTRLIWPNSTVNMPMSGVRVREEAGPPISP